MSDTYKQDAIPGLDPNLNGLATWEQFLDIMGISAEDFKAKTLSDREIRDLQSLYEKLKYLSEFAFHKDDQVERFYRAALEVNENSQIGIMYRMHIAWRRATYPDVNPVNLSLIAARHQKTALYNSMAAKVSEALDTGEYFQGLDLLDTFLEESYRDEKIADYTTFSLVLELMNELNNVVLQKEAGYDRRNFARLLRSAVINKFRAAYSPKFLESMLQELGVSLGREA